MLNLMISSLVTQEADDSLTELDGLADPMVAFALVCTSFISSLSLSSCFCSVGSSKKNGRKELSLDHRLHHHQRNLGRVQLPL
jgi:hypothetical protein